jgi:hypothetical protein
MLCRIVRLLAASYLSQILYGCKSAYCTTPTCLSCNKRNVPRPYRPPTQLTARALAHFLASQDNPRRGLCPHELKVAPRAFEFEHVDDIDPQGGNKRCEYNVYPTVSTLAQHHKPADTKDREMTRSIERTSVIEAVNKRRQTKKDTKSLAQNLYDSITMIYFFSKHIPEPTAVLASLRSTTMISLHAAAPDFKHSATVPVDTSVKEGIQDTESPAQANEPSVAPQTPHGRIARQHSQQNLRARSNSQAENTPPRILNNGQQIHKIPYHPTSPSKRSSISKPLHTMAFDGTSEPATPSTKEDKENSTPGKQSPSAQKRMKASADSVKKAGQTTARIKRTLPVYPVLNCDILDELKEDVYRPRTRRPFSTNFVVDYDANRRCPPTKPIVNRSLFYALSHADTLLKSFHEVNEAFSDSPLPHLDSSRLTYSFRDWNQRNGALIFDSLWMAMEALFTPPPELDAQKSPRLRPSRKNSSSDNGDEKQKAPAPRYLTAHEAAHIVMVCIHALTSLVPIGWPRTWAQLRKLRSWGVIVPNHASNTDTFAHPFMNIIDGLEYDPAIRLAERLLRGIGTRACFEHILASLKSSKQKEARDVSGDTLVDLIIEHLLIVERVAIANKQKLKIDHDATEDPGWTVTATLMEWLRTIIVKKWDNKAEIVKWGSVGTAIMFLDKLRKC